MAKLTDIQREALIKERGEPLLSIEFDVFDGDKVSMWTHFKHGEDFEAAEKRLVAIRDHLNEFLRDKAMCPFTPNKKPAGLDGRF